MAKGTILRAAATGSVRCAVYTRKSTEDGLEQEFNSLDAQREACAAYVLSQRHEGWTLLPDYYDDGGFSGGTMDRPGLKALLAEVEAGRVDVIVVYKVDRLTRSLADFAKIVEILDGAGASFVSVTQAFNTTSSMGRLTLNVLLSFAQFEREVTGERIRDKIAASKKKGLWMGGSIPMGYDVADRKLVPNEGDAEIVRGIYARYLELGTIEALRYDLAERGIVSARRTSRSGRATGGCIFGGGALSWLLRNRIYIGEVQHRGTWYPGEHQGIVDPEVFAHAQVLIERNRVKRKHGTDVSDPSLLAGLVFDAFGRPMRASSTAKGSRRYRYYVSAAEDASQAERRLRVPAAELERAVLDRTLEALSDPETMHRLVEHAAERDMHIPQLQSSLAAEIEALRNGPQSEKRAALLRLVRRATLRPDRLEVEADLAPSIFGRSCDADDRADIDSLPLTLSVPVGTVRAGKEVRMILPPSTRSNAHGHDPALVGLVVKAWAARKALLEKRDLPLDRIAQEFGLTRDYFRVMIRIGFLAPDIVAAVLDGRQPATLTRQLLVRTTDLPLRWDEQRTVLGFDPGEQVRA